MTERSLPQTVIQIPASVLDGYVSQKTSHGLTP
jgi:hypothetical protein